MPTVAVRSGSSSTGFRSISSTGGGSKIGSSGIKSFGSSPSLASRIGSFKTIAVGSKEGSPRSSIGLSARDRSFGSASLKAFNNPSRSTENRPGVKFLGNINTKSISTFGENKSAGPNPVRSEPRLDRSRGRQEIPGVRAEKPIISFQPDRLARGSERFGINNPNRAKGLKRFQNLPYIDLVDRSAARINRIKEAKPVMEVTGVSKVSAEQTKKAERPYRTDSKMAIRTNDVRLDAKRGLSKAEAEKEAVPALQTDKKDKVNPNSDRITAQQARSLLSLEPLVTLGILTQAEAKKRAGITEEDEEKEQDKKKKARTVSQAQVSSQNKPEKTSVAATPEIEPEQVAAKALELTQLLQVMQISAAQDKASFVVQPGQSTGNQILAERAQKLAGQLQEKTGTANTANSDIVETIGQRIQSRFKKVVRVVTRTKKEREEAEEKNDQNIKIRFFQEDHAAKKARIDDAVGIYERIKSQNERNGEADVQISGKEIAESYKLTKDKRGRVLRQQGTELEDGTSVDMWYLLDQIEEITPEKIVKANEIKELMAVEMVDEIKTEASKKEAVRRTFEQNKNIGQIAITEADEQIVSFETVEITTSQAGEATQITKKVEEPEVIEERVIEEDQVVPELHRQLELVQKTLRLERFTIPQRLSLVPQI